MKVFIQNMVSLRCKMLVKSELDKMGLAYKSIELGEVELVKKLSETNKIKLKGILHKSGLEIMDDKNEMLIEKIINIVIEMIHHSSEFPKVNFSIYIADKIQQDYHKLALIFSKTKGITIEHFIILHKVEKIKELIIYDELSLSEISYKLHYSSIAHLSRQFKQVTGLTPTLFKALSKKVRINIEDL